MALTTMGIVSISLGMTAVRLVVSKITKKNKPGLDSEEVIIFNEIEASDYIYKELSRQGKMVINRDRIRAILNIETNYMVSIGLSTTAGNR